MSRFFESIAAVFLLALIGVGGFVVALILVMSLE